MKAKKKEESVTSSFDSFKCLHQAINMIVLNPLLVKSKFQKKLKIYKYTKKRRKAMSINYSKVGDFLLPTLKLENKERFNIGNY